MRVLAENDLADAVLPLIRTRQRLAAADEEAIAEVNALVAQLAKSTAADRGSSRSSTASVCPDVTGTPPSHPHNAKEQTMPRLDDPAKDAEDARQAMRALAHTTRAIENPADVYDVLGAISQTLASAEQVLDQLGAFHDGLSKRDIRPVVADSVRGGRATSYQVSWELHRAAAMTRQIAKAVDHAHELEARVAYSRPVESVVPTSPNATPGLSM